MSSPAVLNVRSMAAHQRILQKCLFGSLLDLELSLSELIWLFLVAFLADNLTFKTFHESYLGNYAFKQKMKVWRNTKKALRPKC